MNASSTAMLWHLLTKRSSISLVYTYSIPITLLRIIHCLLSMGALAPFAASSSKWTSIRVSNSDWSHHLLIDYMDETKFLLAY